MKFNYLLAAAMTFTAHKVMAGGPIEGCLQTHTIASGDTCDVIITKFNLTSKNFYDMNPGLHHADDHLCDNLDDGKSYCVCIKKPCVAESAPANGNSTVSASGSVTSPGVSVAQKDTSSSNTNPALPAVAAVAGSSSSPSSSSSPKSPSTVARSVSSPPDSATGGAVSEKMSQINIPIVVLLLSALAIASL